MNPQPAPHVAAALAEFAPPTAPRECLAFTLGSEEYGIDILRVQEIRSYERPTRIAGTPDCVKGVINLRGVIVPIIDMRIRLQLEPVHYDACTVVIVLNVGRRLMGMVVDAVSEVITLPPEPLHPAGDPLPALAALAQRRPILMDIDKLVSGADIDLVAPTLQ